MTRREIGEKMRVLARVSPEFGEIHSFFSELGGVDKKTYIIISRAKLPKLEAAFDKILGANNSVNEAMKKLYGMNDDQVVHLTVQILDMITKSVEHSFRHISI